MNRHTVCSQAVLRAVHACRTSDLCTELHGDVCGPHSVGMHVDAELLMRLIEREAFQILSVISTQEFDDADETDPRCGPSMITAGTLQLLQDVYDLWATAGQQIDSAASKSTAEAVASNEECAAAVRAVRDRQDEQQQTTSGTFASPGQGSCRAVTI